MTMPQAAGKKTASQSDLGRTILPVREHGVVRRFERDRRPLHGGAGFEGEVGLRRGQVHEVHPRDDLGGLRSQRAGPGDGQRGARPGLRTRPDSTSKGTHTV